MSMNADRVPAPLVVGRHQVQHVGDRQEEAQGAEIRAGQRRRDHGADQQHAEHEDGTAAAQGHREARPRDHEAGQSSSSR